MADTPLDKLTEQTKEMLWYLISQIKTREEAIAFQNMMNRPLGVLGSKFDLKGKQDYKRILESSNNKKS